MPVISAAAPALPAILRSRRAPRRAARHKPPPCPLPRRTPPAVFAVHPRAFVGPTSDPQTPRPPVLARLHVPATLPSPPRSLTTPRCPASATPAIVPPKTRSPP